MALETRIKTLVSAAIAADVLVCVVTILGLGFPGFSRFLVLCLLPLVIARAFIFVYQHHLSNRERLAETRHLSAALRDCEERFTAAFDHAAGMGLVNGNGNLLRVNKSLCDLLGYSEDELLATTLPALSHPEDAEWMQKQIASLLEDGVDSIQLEQRLMSKDHRVVWVVISVIKIAEAQQLLLQVQDVTSRKEAEERLLLNAMHDPLTGLPNRALYLDHLRKTLARWKRRKNGAFAVLFMDLDGFKVINDTLGHVAGDQLLVEFTQRLLTSIRPGDTFARVGGDEFSILLDDLTDLNDALMAVKRYQELLEEPFSVSGRPLSLTVSFGLALSAAEYVDVEELLRHADAAMYRAKRRGKGQYQVFDLAASLGLERQSRIEADLSRAVERAELQLQYQPIVALATGRIVGFEALLRWQHPTLGLIAPPDFIKIAEATGAIVPIGQWVLEEGCRQTREWQRICPQDPPLYVSINLSVRQFTQPHLVEQVAVALHKVGLDPSSLRLEITETMLMNADTAIRMLSELHALGVGLSIDDFGTGYSSLSYLHRLPISTLKIDRSFVDAMSQNREGYEIVRTIITLANSLNLTIVAEGIETNEQLEMLQALNCQYGQGHFFSKALKVEWAASLLFTNANVAFATPAQSEAISSPGSVLTQ